MELPVSRESDIDSQKRLLEQGLVQAEFPPLLSPNAHRPVATYGRVHLAVEVPRDAYHAGPWPIGRPRLDESVCLQAAVLDWHMQVAAAAQIRVFVEIIYDNDYDNVAAGG